MDAANYRRIGRRGRWAVAALFFMNGFLSGSWAPQIPVFQERLGISEFTLGLLILLFGVGAIVGDAMVRLSDVAPRLAHGGASASPASPPSRCCSWRSRPMSPLAAVAMFLFGGLIGGMDVAMNANAVVVERHMSRAIMSSSHGFLEPWRLLSAAGLGGLVIQNFGHLAHAAAVTAIAFAVFVAGAAQERHRRPKPHAVHEHRKFSLPKSPTVYLVGLMALFSMIPEGAVLDWARALPPAGARHGPRHRRFRLCRPFRRRDGR